ncbi:MAG: hypothetical protein HZY79_01915 [Rhodoblastus sp.]|nr:MAG: hypothetical protein HZY79_01915 [Rhodoblastus sp.]
MLVSFLLTSASFEPAAAQQEAPHRPQAAAHAFQNVSQAGGGPIKIIYVVPDDRRERQDFNSAIADAARDFQTWLGAQLDGKSIALASPAVTVFHSQRNAAWFKGDASPPSYFWRITTKELTGLGLVKYNDPNMRYLIFVDADLRCGQSGAGGDGIAVLEANNLRGWLAIRSSRPVLSERAPIFSDVPVGSEASAMSFSILSAWATPTNMRIVAIRPVIIAH